MMNVWERLKKNKKHLNGSQLCSVQPLCNYWINEECIHHLRLWCIKRGTNCTWRKRFMHLLLGWRRCEFGRQRWGKMQLRVLCYLNGAIHTYYSYLHNILLFIILSSLTYSWIHRKLGFVRNLLQMCVHIERVRWPDRLTMSCRPLKKPKAMPPLFLSSLGADTGQTNPCDYVPWREPVCLHVQMYCLSHVHTCV